MKLETVNYKEKNKYLVCFFWKYLDKISYYKIFQYLYDNFHFDPVIIHSDYENSLALVIKEAKYFSNEIIHIRCLFHFMQAIRDKCRKFGLLIELQN